MLRNNVTKSLLALGFAASFTFVSAQSWDMESSSDEPASETSESSFGSESSFDSPSSFGGGFSDSYSESVEPEPEAAPAETKAKKPAKVRSSELSTEQKTCPVCVSKRLKKNIYVDHDGQRIYLCSIACKGRVSRNPQAFIKKLEKRGEKIEGL